VTNQLTKERAALLVATPACGADLSKLKQARDLAARLVGGDPSNKPVCHPIRWPGSWHRKTVPRRCEIAALAADREINLETALSALIAAAPKPTHRNAKSDGAGAPPAASGSSAEMERLASALAAIRAEARDIWLSVGFVLYDMQAADPRWRGREMWDAWSKSSEKLNARGQDAAWQSFGRAYDGPRVTAGTIYMWAREAGWTDPHTAITTDGLLRPYAHAALHLRADS